jgi:hypothetical protein
MTWGDNYRFRSCCIKTTFVLNLTYIYLGNFKSSWETLLECFVESFRKPVLYHFSKFEFPSKTHQVKIGMLQHTAIQTCLQQYSTVIYLTGCLWLASLHCQWSESLRKIGQSWGFCRQGWIKGKIYLRPLKLHCIVWRKSSIPRLLI